MNLYIKKKALKAFLQYFSGPSVVILQKLGLKAEAWMDLPGLREQPLEASCIRDGELSISEDQFTPGHMSL